MAQHRDGTVIPVHLSVGEAVTSALYARQLSAVFDWLVTVDAHLHRRKTLSEIYSIPALDVAAAPAVSAWIREHVENPLVIGPDSESERWAAAVAAGAGAPIGTPAAQSGQRPGSYVGRSSVAAAINGMGSLPGDCTVAASGVRLATTAAATGWAPAA